MDGWMGGWTEASLFYSFTTHDGKQCWRKQVPSNLKHKMSQTFGIIIARSTTGPVLHRQDLLCSYDQQQELPALGDDKGKIPESYKDIIESCRKWSKHILVWFGKKVRPMGTICAGKAGEVSLQHCLLHPILVKASFQQVPLKLWYLRVNQESFWFRNCSTEQGQGRQQGTVCSASSPL